MYGFNGFLSNSPDIKRVEIVIDPADAVWFDDAQFDGTSTSSVQEDEGLWRSVSWGSLKVSVGH